MPKTEYTIEDGGGLRMEFDVFYDLDEAGYFRELGAKRLTKLSVCPDGQFYRVQPDENEKAQLEVDAENMAEQLYSSEIIEQIEGELLAAKQADGERRRELE